MFELGDIIELRNHYYNDDVILPKGLLGKIIKPSSSSEIYLARSYPYVLAKFRYCNKSYYVRINKAHIKCADDCDAAAFLISNS